MGCILNTVLYHIVEYENWILKDEFLLRMYSGIRCSNGLNMLYCAHSRRTIFISAIKWKLFAKKITAIKTAKNNLSECEENKMNSATQRRRCDDVDCLFRCSCLEDDGKRVILRVLKVWILLSIYVYMDEKNVAEWMDQRVQTQNMTMAFTVSTHRTAIRVVIMMKKKIALAS